MADTPDWMKAAAQAAWKRMGFVNDRLDQVQHLETELHAAYERGIARERERAAKVAANYIEKPLKGATGWTEDQTDFYETGGADNAIAIAAAIRKVDE